LIKNIITMLHCWYTTLHLQSAKPSYKRRSENLYNTTVASYIRSNFAT